jgi:hypothetical protein
MCEFVNSLEDVIDISVSVSTSPPSFDDASIVSMCQDSAANVRDSGDSVNEQFKSHSFCPSDVTLAIAGFPTRYQVPRSPVIANDYAQAYARTGI